MKTIYNDQGFSRQCACRKRSQFHSAILAGFNKVAVKQPNVATSYWRPSRPCQANEMLKKGKGSA